MFLFQLICKDINFDVKAENSRSFKIYVNMENTMVFDIAYWLQVAHRFICDIPVEYVSFRLKLAEKNQTQTIMRKINVISSECVIND